MMTPDAIAPDAEAGPAEEKADDASASSTEVPSTEAADTAREPTESQAAAIRSAISTRSSAADAEEPTGSQAAAEPPAEREPNPENQPHAESEPAAEDNTPAARTTFDTPIPVTATTGGYKSGTIVEGTITSVTSRELELDLGEGRVAVVGSRHWTSGLDVDLREEVKVGDIVSAAVLVREDHKRRIVLSRSWGLQLQAWQQVAAALESNSLISGTVVDAKDSGWTVDIGIRAFVPASLTGSENPEELLGQNAEFKVMEVDQPKNRCILSRKAALRTLQRRADRQRLEEIKEGNLLSVKVTEIQGGGAVVIADGRFRTFIRRSELSWSQVRRISSVVRIGDELEARVVQTFPSKARLNLSLRMGEDPFKKLRKGKNYEGTVGSLTADGAFVSIHLANDSEGGNGFSVSGLVSNEELVEYPIRHPSNVVVPGDNVAVQVIGINRRNRQLDLSVNRAMLLQPASEENNDERNDGNSDENSDREAGD